MKNQRLGSAGRDSAAALAWHAPALADDSIEERLSKMEQRIEYLEERVASQDQVIVEKDREMAALSAGERGAWQNRVEISGLVELDAVSSKDYAGDRSTEANLATLEIGLAAPINDTVSAEILVEKDDEDDIGEAGDTSDLIADRLGGLEANNGEDEENNVFYSDPVPAFAASIVVGVDDITVIAEYVTATENFQPSEIAFRDAGAEPSAMGFEVAYGFDLAGSDATFALGYQKSDQAVALELPRERVLGALSVGIMENVTLALEWARDDDYSLRDGGTAEEADTVTLLLGAEF